MTHNQYEKGERLTIHNANKEQLKFMIKDKENYIKILLKRIDEEQEESAKKMVMLVDLLSYITATYGEQATKDALIYIKRN